MTFMKTFEELIQNLPLTRYIVTAKKSSEQKFWVAIKHVTIEAIYH
jgi:hypothetical protein